MFVDVCIHLQKCNSSKRIMYHALTMWYSQYPLYTIMVFDEWRNGIPVAFFIISRSREQDLYPVLRALDRRLRTIATNWRPSAIIVDNAQAEINTLRLVIHPIQNSRNCCTCASSFKFYILCLRCLTSSL